MLVLGEVQTGTLMHSAAAAPALAEQVLALVCGDQVRISARPVGHAASPDTFTGVDCEIGVGCGRQVRCVGTLAGRATLTGGRVLQGSVAARIVRGVDGWRRPWPHYLAQPGVVETMGRVIPDGVGESHLRAEPTASTMGMGAVCGRLLAQVQQSPHLDQNPPFAAGRTTLRWVAETVAVARDERVGFTIEDEGVRTLRLATRSSDVSSIVELCEDISLHDWLLTVLLDMVDRSRIGVGEPGEVVRRLRPAVDHILSLWMPAARLGRDVAAAWRELERSSGLSRQWCNEAQRVRDQIALGAALMNQG